VCGVLHCPAGPQAEQRIAKFSALSIQLRVSQPTCKPTFEGVELSDLGVARQSNPYGAGLSQNENFIGSNRDSVGWCGSKCHSF
jgi:hypothetical protein